MSKTVWAILLAWCALAPATAPAQATAAATTQVLPAVQAPPAPAPALPLIEAEQPERTEAALTLFNRTVFVFRGSLTGYTSADRARRAKARIRERLALDGPQQVTLVPDALGLRLQIDGATVFHVTDADVDSSLGETRESVGLQARAALQNAIAESRESRDAKSLLHAASWALGASGAALLLVWLVLRARSRLSLRLQHWLQHHSQRVPWLGIALLDAQRLARLVRMLLNGLTLLILSLVAFNWLGFVLARFPYTRAWGETLSSWLLGLAASVGTAIVGALPGLFTALVIFWMARGVNRALAGFFDRVQDGQLRLNWLQADVVMPTRRISNTLVWLFALAMAYPYLPGSSTEAFKGLTVLAGLMLSLGASNLVGQAASGLILTYGRVFRQGEFVRVAEHEGTVTEMGMFATRIRTGLGEELTISNSKILDSTTKNYSRVVKGAGFVLDTKVTIGYDTAWRQVHAMLIEAAQRTEGVLADPAPVVFQTALSDWYPEYRLVCQAVPSEPRPRALVLSQLHANIQDVFNAYGVQIMSPQYMEDPARPKVVPPEHWYPAPAQPASTAASATAPGAPAV